MKNIFVLFLALLLAGCNVTAFNVFSYDPYAAMQPTSTQAAPTVTATAEPTEPWFSSTPTTDQLVSKCTVTAPEALNLRSGPGTQYTVISWLEAGESLTRLPSSPAGLWWKVTTADNRTGYVNSNFCKE